MSGIIERIDLYRLHIPLRRTLSDALYTRTHWHVPVVEITTDDGLVGTGYSGVWAGDDLLLSTIDGYLRERLMGRNSAHIGEIWNDIYWSPLHWVGRAGIAHMALGMVDIALWDLAAQRAETPLWKLLGGRHTALETYNTDGGWLNFTVDELHQDMGSMVERGWNRVKMKVGGTDPAVDLERVRAVRAALPDGVTMMVDANQNWDLWTALRTAPRLGELGIAWLEEPLHPDDVAGHRRLAATGAIPIALGENLYSSHAFSSFLDADAVDVVQVDVTRVAGITEWLEIARSASAASCRVIPHAGDMMQVHQHLVAGTESGKQPLIEYLPWATEAFAQPVTMDGSRILLQDVPGASTAIAADARRRWQV